MTARERWAIPAPAPCFCGGALCDYPAEWTVTNRRAHPVPLLASDLCVATAMRRAGTPAIVAEIATAPP